MFSFLIKGLFRDKTRFLLPLVVVTIGAAITVMMSGYVRGWLTELINQNACIDTGHVKVMTRAYAEKKNQHPNELAILNSDSLIARLEKDYPGWTWKKRIHFGGIIDTSTDGSGDVLGKQGPISAMALDFKNIDCESDNLKLKALVSGALPKHENQVTIGKGLSEKLGLDTGDEFTFLGSTMNGGFVFQPLEVSSVISFGIPEFDRGVILVDLKTAEQLLDMDNAAGEVLGFWSGGYDPSRVKKVTADFNSRYSDSQDRFAPMMWALEEQNQLGELIQYYDAVTNIFIAIFIFAMSLVMWNTGLVSGIRRYREFGIRLALGETKGGLYRFLILEAVFIGCVGSALGTLIGLGFIYYLKTEGLDFSSFLQDSTALIPTVIRAEFTFSQFYIGFIPGLFSVVMGAMLAGIGVFKRQTANLLKELEV